MITWSLGELGSWGGGGWGWDGWGGEGERAQIPRGLGVALSTNVPL